VECAVGVFSIRVRVYQCTYKRLRGEYVNIIRQTSFFSFFLTFLIFTTTYCRGLATQSAEAEAERGGNFAICYMIGLALNTESLGDVS